ncbi:MAG: hypothetical protein ACKO3W_09725 [bacterium]
MISLIALVPLLSIFSVTRCTSPCVESGLEMVTSADVQEQAKRAPDIWVTAWRRVPPGQDLLVEMVRLEGEFVPGRPNRPPEPADIARRTQLAPPGRASILWWRFANSLFAYEADALDRGVASPWVDGAIAQLKGEWEPWLDEFRRAGGRLDVLVGDCEQNARFRNWNIPQSDIRRIMDDPRAQRPYLGVEPLSSMLGTLDPTRVKNAAPGGDYLVWNQAMGRLNAAAMDRAIFQPALARFPALVGSNYDGARTRNKPAPDLNGHLQPEDCIVGTHAAPSCYGRIEQVSTGAFIDPNDPTRVVRQGTERLAKSPWTSFLLDVQLARSCVRSAPDVPLAPWIAQAAWTGDRGEVPYPSDRRVWDEMVRHLSLCRTEFFHYWNPPEVFGPAADSAMQQRIAEQCSMRLLNVLRDINTQTLGRVDRASTTGPLSLRAEIVTSGARRIDGKYVWRTSVKPGVVTLREVGTGATVHLAAGELGRWDITADEKAPRYEVGLRAPTDAGGGGTRLPVVPPQRR